MARKFGNINQLSGRFEDYNYMILGEGGIGKTTMAYEIGKYVTGNDEGTFIITFGMENKVKHIPGAFFENAGTFGEWLDIVEDLCDNKADYPYTKFICIDSVDEMYRLAEEYVIAEYNKTADMDKRAKSIKQAYGGYQAGENRVIDIVLKSMSSLDNAGYHFINIGHTKTKSKSDPVTGITYEQFTCGIDNKYYNAIKDKVNLVATGYFEREFENLKTKDNPFTKEKGGITTGELIGQRRVLTLVDDENAIDTKCHFEYIEPKIAFGAKSLVDTVNEALRKKRESLDGEIHKTTHLPGPDDDIIAKRAEFKKKYMALESEKKKEIKAFMDENGLKLDNTTEEQLNRLNEFLA